MNGRIQKWKCVLHSSPEGCCSAGISPVRRHPEFRARRSHRRIIGMTEFGNFLGVKNLVSREMPSVDREITSLAVLAPSPLFRSGLVALLSTMGFGSVEEATDLKELAGRTKDARRPAILLISLRQSEGDLSALIQEIKAWAPKGKVVFIAPTFDLQALSACFTAGAVGYLVENISRDALQHSLELVRAGEKIFPSALASALSIGPKASGPSETKGEQRTPPLAEQEIEILRCLAQGESNSLIGRQLGISEVEVSTHIKHLLRKLRVSNRTQAALWSVAQGLSKPLAAFDRLAETVESEEKPTSPAKKRTSP